MPVIRNTGLTPPKSQRFKDTQTLSLWLLVHALVLFPLRLVGIKYCVSAVFKFNFSLVVVSFYIFEFFFYSLLKRRIICCFLNLPILTSLSVACQRTELKALSSLNLPPSGLQNSQTPEHVRQWLLCTDSAFASRVHFMAILNCCRLFLSSPYIGDWYPYPLFATRHTGRHTPVVQFFWFQRHLIHESILMDGSFQGGSSMLDSRACCCHLEKNRLYLVSRKFFQYLASETVAVLVFLTLRASRSGTFLHLEGRMS